MKANALSKKILGKSFGIESLCSNEGWVYEKLEGKSLKCVMITPSFDKLFIHRNLSDGDNCELLDIKVHFLVNPNPLLNDKKNLTDKERELLKILSQYYDCATRGMNPMDGIFNDNGIAHVADELYYLKHRHYMHFSLTWSYTFEKIVSNYFLTTGLKAVDKLC